MLKIYHSMVRGLFYASLLLLVGCGFHLRGYNMVPTGLHILYLQSANPYDKFTVQLRSNLRTLGVVLVQSPNQAPFSLQILNDSFTQNLSSISGNTFVRTYTLNQSATFQIANKRGVVLYGPKTVTTSTTYTTNDNQLLGDSDVLHKQQAEMQRELIFQMFNFINSRTGNAAIGQP